MPSFTDREFCHVYLYMDQKEHMDVHLQKEEVAGLYRARLMDAQQLLNRECEKMNIEGFEVDADGKRREEKREVHVHDFVPHEPAYYEHLFQAINQFLSQ